MYAAKWGVNFFSSSEFCVSDVEGDTSCNGAYRRMLSVPQSTANGKLPLTGQCMALLRREVSSTEFRSSKSTCIRYSKQHSHLPGALTEFVWKDYCPTIFRNLQALGDIDYEDYMMSVCGHETLMELFLRGKGGRPIYLPKDNRFVIKTLKKSEVKVLIEMLPSYYCHVRNHAKTLLTKFYGLHAARPVLEGQKVYFVVMENVLRSELPIHRRYDLKGSSQGRTMTRLGDYQTTTLKDFDFDFFFYLDPSIRVQLIEQIKSDCKFLEEQGIMDYSLLLGIHREVQHRGTSIDLSICKGESFSVDAMQGKHKRDPTLADFFEPIDRPGFKFGMKLPARAVKIPRNDKGSSSLSRRVATEESCNALLYFGIIDFLQGYNMMKRIEHAYKSIQYNSKTIPSVNPKAYSARFLDFLCRVFQPEESSS
ncbi:hypothetical protein Nepgr_024284 [Nepenthes gracilis]|uniref:1-phosphatidylinositol-4-phosphate 5-kinase n=1 Tax=Nepenthes gracilis TaxID=150966 RepID=A0AAD3Y0B7_NEPGR|nr:hypothetical protein Nepgr_024284 [Nepenthes gracilis]